jgi:HlyD family secretion protein
MQQTSDAGIEVVPPSKEHPVPAIVPERPVAKAPGENLPVFAPDRTRKNSRRWRRIALALVVLAGAAGGADCWWSHRTPPLPAGIVTGNGRIEADPVGIATKFAGRILELRVDEGDKVKAGQVLAVMDTRDLEASLKKSEAQAEAAKKAVSEARANVDQLHSQVIFAEQEMERARALLTNGWVTRETFDQRKQTLDGAKASELPAQERVTEAERALDAANHLADQAQFTPKMVETQTERDKLMFRIRVRIDPARSSAHADVVRSGLPNVAYVLTDPKTEWPDRLRVKS